MKIPTVSRAVQLWRGLRRLFGDDAYDRYFEHMRLHHPHVPPLARADFYQQDLEQRWSGVNRCC